MNRVATWANVGKDITNITSLEDVLESCKLNYEVETQPIQLESGLVVPGKVATVRKSDNHIYGVVSSNYSICQNIEAFDFIDQLQGEVTFVKAGETTSGIVYIICKLLKIEILGDEFEPYIIFQNNHNGISSVKAAITPLRIVCQNQFNYAFRNANNTISIRHTSDMHANLIVAQQVMQNSVDYLAEFKNLADKLASKKVSPLEFESIIDNLFPIQNIESYALAKRNAFIQAYNAEDNQNFKGSIWGLVNAYSDYMTHYKARKSQSDESKFQAVTFDPTFLNRFLRIVNACTV